MCFCSRIRNILFDNCFDPRQPADITQRFCCATLRIELMGRWQKNSTQNACQSFEMAAPNIIVFGHCVLTSSNAFENDLFHSPYLHRFFFLFSFNIDFCCCNSIANNKFSAWTFQLFVFVSVFIHKVNRSVLFHYFYISFAPIYLVSPHEYISRSSVRFTIVSSVVLCRLFPLCSRYRLDID